MTGAERAELRAAIVGAYHRATFDRLLSDRLDFRRALHVADGPFADVVDGVLDRFIEEAREAYLIAEIAADRPARPDIQRIYRAYAQAILSDAWRGRIEEEMCQRLARYGLLPVPALQQGGVARETAPVDDFAGFQRQVRAALPELDVAAWSARLVQLSQRVCRVEVDGVPYGTGFLVGPAAVLTCHHVVREAIEMRCSGSALGFRFDYGGSGAAAPAAAGGTWVAARGGDWAAWHVDSSPAQTSAQERAGDARADHLDHVVIALDQPLGDAPVAPGGPRRGWIEIPQAPALTVGMPVAILHHPRHAPLRLTLDTRGLLRVNAARTRIRYATNTDGGSSGSPCFNLELGLIGVHHLTDPEHEPPRYNQGVAIEAIRRRLAERGRLSVLGGTPPCS